VLIGNTLLQVRKEDGKGARDSQAFTSTHLLSYINVSNLQRLLGGEHLSVAIRSATSFLHSSFQLMVTICSCRSLVNKIVAANK